MDGTTDVQRKEAGGYNGESAIGVLNVFIHQARDIQNICIYHKQDVYAKICLTSDLDKTVSSKIINGGGINPVFNDNLKIHVRTVESSLKCEVWMLSRVKNYLEDQLLGFTVIPLSEIIFKNGNVLEKEFCLSSTDLFHSPSGFIRLSIGFSGTRGGAGAMTCSESMLPVVEMVNDEEILKGAELDKIEFPDPKVVNENQMMVSEYYGFDGLESGISPENDEEDKQIVGVNLVESFSSGNVPINVSGEEDGEGKESSAAAAAAAVNIAVVVPETETKMVEKDIVDMYTKSMQQFTDSLAKMKLPPVDAGNGTSEPGRSAPAPTKTHGSKVFYGSRAFF